MKLNEFSIIANTYRAALGEISRLVEVSTDANRNIAIQIEEQRQTARKVLRRLEPIVNKFAIREIDLGDGESADVLSYACAIGSVRGSGAIRIATIFLDAFGAYLERLVSEQGDQELEYLVGEKFIFSNVRWGSSTKEEKVSSPRKGSVFLVHGHNDLMLHETARFIERLGLCTVVLRELPNSGRSIIEKFIDHSDVEFAVVLLTADDVGRSGKAASESLSPRARQNVIFELGFFIGKLGRKKVCTLYEPEVEIPSDYSGVLFIKIDKGGMWRLQLAKELKAVDISVDLNRI